MPMSDTDKIIYRGKAGRSLRIYKDKIYAFTQGQAENASGTLGRGGAHDES
jgi:hypothetical protein